MTFWLTLLLFVIVSVAMILIILVQRPQGGGLSGAFGGASVGGSDTVFGGRTGDALTYATVAAFIVYLTLAITLNLIEPTARAAVDEQADEPTQQQQQPQQPQPQQPGAPAGRPGGGQGGGDFGDIDPEELFGEGGIGGTGNE